jgi:hypothetical protein
LAAWPSRSPKHHQDGVHFEDDPARFPTLAATLKPLARPSEAIVDDAHEAVWSDALPNAWALDADMQD